MGRLGGIGLFLLVSCRDALLFLEETGRKKVKTPRSQGFSQLLGNRRESRGEDCLAGLMVMSGDGKIISVGGEDVGGVRSVPDTGV